jgi:hypothetical protein
MAADTNYSTLNRTLEGPPSKAIVITPNDSTDIIPDKPIRYFMVGATGDLSVILQDDTNPVTLTGLIAGIQYYFMVKRIRATNTTATGIIGFY